MVSTRSMASRSGKRKPTDKPVSRPPSKRRALNGNASRKRPSTPKRASPPRRARKQPVRPPSPHSAASSTLKSPVNSYTEDADVHDANTKNVNTEDVNNEEVDIEEEEVLLDRIHSGVAYIQQQHSLGKPILQTTNFQIDTSNPLSHESLTLLRRHGTLIASALPFELFELGIPRPNWVAEGVLPGLHDPQWWVGKSLAEIKAGPFAEEADVRRAAAYLKGLETKKGKKRGLTDREKENERKLSVAMEGLKDEDKDEGEGEDGDEEVEGGRYTPSA